MLCVCFIFYGLALLGLRCLSGRSPAVGAGAAPWLRGSNRLLRAVASPFAEHRLRAQAPWL